MKRSEARRIEKIKTPTYNLTKQQIDQLKKASVDEAMSTSFVLMIGIPIMALRDEFGFGKQRLEKFSNKILGLFDGFQNGYFTLDDLYATIEEETGMKIREVKK